MLMIPYFGTVVNGKTIMKCSFAHPQFDTDIVFLGNGERATIYLIATPAGLTLDDFEITYEGSKLSVDISEMWSDEGKTQRDMLSQLTPLIPEKEE